MISLDLPAPTGWGLLGLGCKTSGASQVLPEPAVTQLVAPTMGPQPPLPQHHAPRQSPAPHVQRCPGIARRAKRFQRENFDVFKKVARENICPVLNKQCCLKQSKQLSVLSPPTPCLELPERNEWKGKPLIDLTRFYHLFS